MVSDPAYVCVLLQWNDLLADIEAAYRIVSKTPGGPVVPPDVGEFLRAVLRPPPVPVRVRK